jgi:sulfite exporter TauE/SafE
MELAAAESWALPLTMLVAGLASGVHCLGMCGGIISAFSARRVISLPDAARAVKPEWPRQLAFNSGRIASYTAAGAVVGSVGGLGVWIAGALPAQTVLFVLANAMLVLVGLYLAGAGGALVRLEALGAPLWRRLQPLAARLLPADTLPRSFAAGALWGWLPCGLVYGALAAAAFAGSPERGALVMLAFGLGTLPNLLAAGLAATRLRAWAGRRSVRIAAGTLLLGFGVFGLAHASGLAEGIRRGLLCL